jgi:hypothetical protein
MHRLTVTFVPGRVRRGLHGALVIVLMCGGYLWLGDSGAALVLLWGVADSPRRERITLEIRLELVAEVRLYSRALVVREYGRDFFWIFADEMPPVDYAALRRTLKTQIEGLS